MKFELMPILEINSSSSEVFSIKLFQFQQKSKTQETHVILSGQRKKKGYIRFAQKTRKKQARKTKTILCTIIERDNSCICGYYK